MTSSLPSAYPTFPGFKPAAFEFLQAIEANNNREWFQAQKQTYHQDVRNPFIAFMEAASNRLDGSGLNLRGGKQSVFRIYRDVRFSKDKTPYKTHLGGVLSYSGTKKDTRGVIYIQFGIDGGFVAAGFYQPGSQQLGAIRTAIAESPEEVLNLAKALSDRGLPLQATESLKRMPRGFESFANSEVANLLKMKGYIIRQGLTPALWRSHAVVETVAQFAHSAYPWLAFGREALANARLKH
ncbi:MAG: TIGR02453 family protein [Cyanobacteria bacterium J06627_32]